VAHFKHPQDRSSTLPPRNPIARALYHPAIMTSERAQKRIDRLLDQAEEAMDWQRVRKTAQALLGVDANNADAKSFLSMAESVAAAGDSGAESENAMPSRREPRRAKTNGV
jgi:hypothetical protein